MFRRKCKSIRKVMASALVLSILLSFFAPAGTAAATTEDGDNGIQYVPISQITATASSVHQYAPAETPDKAIDGYPWTQWRSDSVNEVNRLPDNPQWIRLDLGGEYNVTQFKSLNVSRRGILTDHEVWVSNDDIDYDKVYDGTGEDVIVMEGSNERKWIVDNFEPVPARYVKLVVKAAVRETAEGIEEYADVAITDLQVGYAEGDIVIVQPVGIEITAPPAKTAYYTGESLNTDGLEVTAAFEDETLRVLAAGEYTLSGFDSATEGTKTVTVTYRSLTATFEVTVEEAEYEIIEGRTTVISPAYRAEISGDTEIQFVCPGGTTASVFVQKQPADTGNVDTNGTREAVGGIITLTNGYGSVVFPAGEYPDGPITLRIKVWKNGADLDDCYLQLYNTNGVEWKKGLENAPVNPVTEGMEITFADDFKTMPSISFSGEGTTYTSNKPDERQGGQFGFATFENFEGPYNPFSLSWRRI